MVKVEFCRTADGTPHREIFLQRKQIPAINRGILQNVRGIRRLRIVGPDIREVAGFNWRNGFFCYTLKEGSRC